MNTIEQNKIIEAEILKACNEFKAALNKLNTLIPSSVFEPYSADHTGHTIDFQSLHTIFETSTANEVHIDNLLTVKPSFLQKLSTGLRSANL